MNPALGGPVEILEGHCAPADVMPTAKQLFDHITKVPHDVHSLTRMVFISSVNADVINLRSEEGYMKCDYDKLVAALVEMGRRTPHFWFGLTQHCTKMFCEQKVEIRDAEGKVVEEVSMSDDPNSVHLTVRGIRGLAELCYREEKDARQEHEESEASWIENVMRPSHAKGNKKKKKNKKSKKKKKIKH